MAGVINHLVSQTLLTQVASRGLRPGAGPEATYWTHFFEVFSFILKEWASFIFYCATYPGLCQQGHVWNNLLVKLLKSLLSTIFPLTNFWVKMKFQKQLWVSLDTVLPCVPKEPAPVWKWVTRWPQYFLSGFQNTELLYTLLHTLRGLMGSGEAGGKRTL